MAEKKNKYVSPEKLGVFLNNLKNIFSPLKHSHKIDEISDYTVDNELSANSTNPVANSALNAEFDAISDAMGALELAIDDKADKTNATTTAAGLMAAGDKTKLDGIAAGAEKNIVYVGSTEPTDPNIKVWINTAEEGTGVIPVLPRLTTITLTKSGWTGSNNPYSQTVTASSITATDRIELCPTAQQIVQLQNDDVALMAENNGGSLIVYSIGGKPSVDMTMQILLSPVSYV